MVRSLRLMRFSRMALLIGAVLFCLLVADRSRSAWAAEIQIACDKPVGVIRPLHGVNGGPLNYGETVDLSAYWRELAIPLTRLHDCEWPNPSVVDIHAVFPSLQADPALPESYQFARTDDYVQAISGTGAGIVYRLGESIEHSRRKHHVAPPADYERWTAACIGVIRHFNEGWADGGRRQIRYWEIWNEPENRPVMWTGSDDDYYRLYATAAKGIKVRFPDLLLGGPSVGATGDVVAGRYRPTPFIQGFARHCQANKAPLDFFSWHTYTDDPGVYKLKAQAIREWLNEQGFRQTEIHLNEWNYLPGNDWGPMLSAGQGLAREKWYQEMGGPSGAAFIAHVLIDLQDSPVDVANLYCGDTGPFGLFSRHGAPKKTFYAVKAFRQLLDTPRRVSVTCAEPAPLAVCAGVNAERTKLTILVSNYQAKDQSLDLVLEKLPWPGRPVIEARLLDESHNLEQVKIECTAESPWRIRRPLPAPTVLLIQIQQAEK